MYKVVAVGLMELGWEVQRWSPAINTMMGMDWCYGIVVTLADRIDLYKGYAQKILVDIEGIYTAVRPECFRMVGFNYDEFIKDIKTNYVSDAVFVESNTFPTTVGNHRIRAEDVLDIILERMKQHDERNSGSNP